VKLFDACKTRMIALAYGKKNYDDMLSRFHTIPACYGRTDGRTDRQTDRIAISISRVSSSILTRDKTRLLSSYFSPRNRNVALDHFTYTVK